ncbi:hypothetical protein Henu3_gp83 [Mycobacterium phage Henu3]|uniref:Uncharacterized protein n=1 Tax=Mycobacterium phage Henu3 TaxID=2492961 RepID=A0A410T879_9CAUD|nr:hypothetical protein I5G68_gp70 [Mycobacterium phage Henu3]QAU05015.1 hypothetical protein Henu3_gp83 [Mycobacterium phage Henu3]
MLFAPTPFALGAHFEKLGDRRLGRHHAVADVNEPVVERLLLLALLALRAVVGRPWERLRHIAGRLLVRVLGALPVVDIQPVNHMSQQVVRCDPALFKGMEHSGIRWCSEDECVKVVPAQRAVVELTTGDDEVAANRVLYLPNRRADLVDFPSMRPPSLPHASTKSFHAFSVRLSRMSRALSLQCFSTSAKVRSRSDRCACWRIQPGGGFRRHRFTASVVPLGYAFPYSVSKSSASNTAQNSSAPSSYSSAHSAATLADWSG